MSVHDAVVILTLTNDIKKEYRTSYVPNIQTLSSFTTLKTCFSTSPVFTKMSEAVLHARAINKKNPNRYGVLKMNRYSYYEWEDILEGANREQKKMSNNPPFDA